MMLLSTKTQFFDFYSKNGIVEEVQIISEYKCDIQKRNVVEITKLFVRFQIFLLLINYLKLGLTYWILFLLMLFIISVVVLVTNFVVPYR